MRKWFPDTCHECGSDIGYWDDVVEGPITPEEHYHLEELNQQMQSIYGPIINKMLDDYRLFEGPARPVTGETITFPIRRRTE